MLRRRGAWVVGDRRHAVHLVAGQAAPTTYWATQFLYFRAPYAELGVGDAEGMWIRARLIVVALDRLRRRADPGPAPAQRSSPGWARGAWSSTSATGSW